MNKNSYQTINEHNEYQIPKIKGSIFMGNIFHIESKEEAEKHIKEIEKKYPDASHHCFAYRYDVQMNLDIFNNKIYTCKYNKVSDAGEPVSTAGKPIMNMIEKHGLHNVLVVVTRYFGGTLLGVGGLIQAYGECAKQVIEHAKISEEEIMKTIVFSYNFDLVQVVRNTLNKYQSKVIEEKYEEKVTMKIAINSGYIEAFKQELFNNSKGEINLEQQKNL
ncbi:MAG TPA: YigZ family protein [Candidatus Absconditabacterales bacterium]|nr:YigZ family protein [Candidatus Absconditabacterales bacterium]